MVRRNLRNSFPDKSETELLEYEHQFYHQFCSVIVEIVYSYRMSIDEVKQRVRFNGLEQLIELNQRYGGSFVMLGHVGCWEWMASIHHHIKDSGITECSVYRRLKQKPMDELMQEIRCRIGGICSEKNQILRTIISRKKDNLPTLYGMLSDQKPSPQNMHFWTTFLNQDTSFLNGTEVLARKYRLPVFFFDITQPQRGYYDVTIHLIAEQPELTDEYRITADYAALLEDNIRLQPHLWLWSHNRWKWQRKDIPANIKTNIT